MLPTPARSAGHEKRARAVHRLPGHPRRRARLLHLDRGASPVKAFFRDNALGLTFGAAFLLALFGQSLAGLADFNNQQLADGTDPVGYLDYLTSSSFAVDVAENWQSEYLQFFLYVFGTVWLF